MALVVILYKLIIIIYEIICFPSESGGVMSRVFSLVVVFSVAAMAAVMAGCAGSSSPSSPQPISVNLSPSSSQAIDQGQTVGITASVKNDTASDGVTWSLTGPGSLSNATASSVTYNSPTATLTSAQQVIVKATSGAGSTQSASLQITVNPYLQIPSQTIPGGSVAASYSQTIALIGGTPPFHWSVYNGPIITGYKVGGAVPDGLRLDPSTGSISGTPTGGGTWYFEMTVTDATGAFAFNGFLSIQINPIAAAGNPAPFLNQTVVPTAVSPGSPGFTISVSGSGFISGATVDWNGAPLTTTFVDTDHLTATVPAASVASAETAVVTVVNPAPGGGHSNAAYFQVGAPEATVSFANATNSPLPVAEATGIVAADFNEDGKPDLAVAANNKLYVLLGNGDGTFTTPPSSPIRVPSPPYDDFGSPYTESLAVADFNNSGHLGLAVAELQNEAAVILLGNGDGTFSVSSAAFANAEGQPTFAIAAADFNRDGNIDLAIVNGASGQSPVELGYGDGAFTISAALNTLLLPTAVAVGDFNGDGMLDAVVSNAGSKVLPVSGLAVSLGRGDGTFTSGPISTISLGSDLSAIVAADFNGDGKLDIAVTDSNANRVTILLGNGDGTFGPPTTIPAGNEPSSIVAGDFNNDGKMDLAVANFGDNTVTLLLGNGDGTFTEALGSPYPAGNGPYQITAADFNGDGKLDLAVADLGGTGTVSILLQQ